MTMRALGLTAVLVAGCTFEEAPTVPSWQVDVMPILAANCVRCHGYPTSGYATFGMRLDSYENTDVVGFDAPIQGAAVNATGIARRTRDGMRPPGELPMPPGRELGRYEGTVLRNWAGLVDGSLKAPRGPGRLDNALPVLALAEVGRDAALVTFSYELRDADGDLVVGSVLGPVLDEQSMLATGVIGDLVAGRDGFAVDLTGIPAGTYDLVARLDDGADVDGPAGVEDYIEVPAGQLVVP
jgi:hypothetical protein